MLNFGFPQSKARRPMDTKQLARISALLDQAKEQIEAITGLAAGTWPMEAAEAHAKINEAQAILLGEKPFVPEDN